MRLRIPVAHSFDGLDSQTRSRVHWQIEGRQVRIAHSFTRQRRTGQVDAGYLMTLGAQPSRWRRQTERLPAQFVSGNEDCFQELPGLLSLGDFLSGVATIVVSLNS